MLYYNFPCRIKYADVEKIVGVELDSNNFHFVSAVIDKKLEELCTDIIEEIVKEAEEKSEEETQPAVDYNSMTINELKDIAKSRNIKGYYRMKKDELVKVLNK